MAVTVVTALHAEVWPPRVLVTVAGLTIGDTVGVYRTSGGVRSWVRGAVAVTVTDTLVHVVDAEHPYGVAVAWGVAVGGVDTAVSAQRTVALAGGLVAVTDAVTGVAVECRISAWADRAWETPGTTMVVGGRTVRVSGAGGGWSSSIELVTETLAQGEALRALLHGCTSGVVMVRQPGGYDRIDSHVAVLSWSETRWSQDAVDVRRTWTVEVMEVDGWPPSYGSRDSTYDDVSAWYAGGTIAGLAADFAGRTWHDVAVLDWAGGEDPAP